MNKLKLILAGLIVSAPLAFASPGDDGCVGNCSGGEGGGAGGQGGSATQSQQQGQRQNSESSAIGVGVGYGEGGSARQGQSQESSNTNLNRNVNDISNNTTSSSRSASGANSDSSSVSGATGGTAVSGGNTQGVAVDASEENTLIYKGDDHAAASAAAVFAEQCQTGMSGQVMEGGFSVINSDQFCDYIKAANVSMLAYEWEMENGAAVCADPMVDDWPAEGYADTCMNEKAQEYLNMYHENTDNALALVQRTEAFGWMDRIFGQLIRPIAVVAAIILLL